MVRFEVYKNRIEVYKNRTFKVYFGNYITPFYMDSIIDNFINEIDLISIVLKQHYGFIENYLDDIENESINFVI